MPARKRQKASDVFAATEFVFSQKTSSFSKAFPEIEDLVVEIVETGNGVLGHGLNRSIYGRSNFPGEFVNCSNPSCYNGGIRIGQLVRNMGYDRTEKWEDSFVLCQGYEGSPKGRRRYRSCLNRFSVKIEITYHDSGISAEQL